MPTVGGPAVCAVAQHREMGLSVPFCEAGPLTWAFPWDLLGEVIDLMGPLSCCFAHACLEESCVRNSRCGLFYTSVSLCCAISLWQTLSMSSCKEIKENTSFTWS